MQAAALDLAPLYRHPVFESRCADETHQELSRLLTSHRLRWGAGSVSTALYRQELRRLSVLFLRYGAEVEVVPNAFDDFVLVQMPLCASAEIECDDVVSKIGEGEVAVLAPRRQVRLHWQPHCEQVIVKIPAQLLQVDSPICKLPRALVPPWLGIVQQLLAIADKKDALNSDWILQFESVVAGFLQMHAQVPTPAADEEDSPLQLRRRARARLEQMEAYMRERLFAPISLADLARAASVSPRTLNEICQAEHGIPPMAVLRRARLEAARRKLLSDSQANVTDVALEFGFGHLGRFSAYYREQFGELPRQTRSH